MYLFNILHSSYSKHYAPLYSGVMSDKGAYIWAIKEAQSFPEKLICCDQSSIAASSLLPHVYTIWWSTFHSPSQLGAERKILHWPPRDTTCIKREWEANWNDFNAYYYCSDCSVCHNIMPLYFFFFFLLSFCFESARSFVNCLGIAQAEPCQ